MTADVTAKNVMTTIEDSAERNGAQRSIGETHGNRMSYSPTLSPRAQRAPPTARHPPPIAHGASLPFSMPDDLSHVRIDKWLWAARFFKTRSLATDAVTGGKVEVNGERAKPAKSVKPGDELKLRLGPYEHILIVRGLAERRGPASVAQSLYEETEASRAARQ